MGQASYVEHRPSRRRDGPLRCSATRPPPALRRRGFLRAGRRPLGVHPTDHRRSRSSAGAAAAADGEDAVGSAAAMARAAVDGGDRRTLHNILSLEASAGTRSADVRAEGAVLRGG